MVKNNRPSIPRVLKNQTWLKHCGRVFDACCRCCHINPMNVFDYHTAHIIAVKNGGRTHLDNLLPTCQKCNLSMGTQNLRDFQLIYGYATNNQCILL
jgi:5-methylcytosine-specific restriction endonuclease McrA